MRTKFLLFALLMLLPWCVKAQETSSIYKVSLTDLPEGLNLQDLDVIAYISREDGYETTFSIHYNEEEGNYVYTDDYGYIGDADQMKLQVVGRTMIPTDTLVWSFVPGQAEQTITVSLQDYRKVTFDIEDGWNFHQKISDSQYQLSGFEVAKVDGQSSLTWIAVGGIGDMVSTPEEQDFYLYAEPGHDYVWNGKITRYADDMKLSLIADQPLVIDETSPALVKPDWESGSLVTFTMKEPLDGISDFYVVLRNVDGSESYNLMPENGKAVGLLPLGVTYEWLGIVASMDADVLPKTGMLTVSDQDVQMELDYSNYVKSTISLKEKSGCPIQSGYCAIFLNEPIAGHEDQMQISLSGDMTRTIYVPKGNWRTYATVDVSDDMGNYISVAPFEKNLSIEGGEQIVCDFSNYSKVSFQCGETPIYTNVYASDAYEDNTVSGNVVLLPNGTYYAQGYYEEAMVTLRQEFTVSGSDMVMNYEYNPEDYTTLTVQTVNVNLLPEEIGYDGYYLSLYQNGKYVDGFYHSAGDGDLYTCKVKNGNYTYTLEVSENGQDCMVVPYQGSLELNGGDKTLAFDLGEDLCLVSVKAVDQQQNPVENFYLMLNDDIYWAYVFETGSGYLLVPKGDYKVFLSAPQYGSITQNLTIGKDTEELTFTMVQEDVYPFIILVDGMERDVYATVTIEGVGSYQVNEEGDLIGDLLPFMSVKSGIYRVTITAPGYVTYSQELEVSADTYSEEDGGVFYEIRMTKEETGVESVEEAAQPVVKTQNGRILVQAEADCRVMVYSLSGVCVFQGQGEKVQTEMLQSGIYMVRMATPAGVYTKKVAVGK